MVEEEEEQERRFLHLITIRETGRRSSWKERKDWWIVSLTVI